ncbi:hypothetical protein QKT26_gp40 [Carcinus maenas nudivirus]|uniref:Uncharacterized protein n=1 Tax=Carcinus maenas nudivirus TaxID=2880837 RepID=A0AAE8Y556_9VIRU|nr:hypothetical protein QKT26_gp40 [Carcinus maenas nudivirus]UBZ25630.1 hypothetical protein CmNV_039 [Carcinus maenas nudivirus]
MSFNDVYNSLKNNKIVITDLFNVFDTPPVNNIFDEFNFIINEEDVVAKHILQKFVKNINLRNTNLNKVYVNPYDTYKSVAALYLRPPQFNLVRKKENSLIFAHKYKKLYLSDNRNFIRHMLNLETIDDIENNVIWEFNPGYDSLINTDILMQKLIGDVIYINTETYNRVVGDIVNYKSFKSLDVVKFDTYTSEECQDDIENTHYTLYGFDLTTKWA